MMDSLKIGNGLPVIGPGTDIGKSSLPVVGYLGKNYDSAKVTPDGYCPACREKGKLKALKTYRISFQESIFLCEDLQCIYPLGSKSLNNLISPDLKECHTPNRPQKRKISETNCKDAPLLAKKSRSHIVTGGEQNLNSQYKGKAYDATSSNLPDDGSHGSPVRAADPLEQNETLEAGNADITIEEDPAAVGVSGTGDSLLQTERSEPEISSESKCLSFCRTSCVQWKNTQALCWLDCILSALVHLEELKNTVSELCSKEECIFWRLFEKYNQANKLLYTSQLDVTKGGDGKKLPSEIFAEIETCLNEVRNEIFSKLQPQLRCTLGEMESPVFAFPLLLKTDPHIEKLFTYSFSWNFECSQCKHNYQNRCAKSLATFTNVVPEWHPLNAAHFGPCNSCNTKSQIRKMILETVPPIFMLHFVEGLPHNDLQHYAFHFEGGLYRITSVIQYQASNHFITWVLCADGSWLECDDLKGPCTEKHEKFEVPASEIHIVIWERKILEMTDKESAHLSLMKPNDRRVLGEEKASPALSSAEKTTTAEASVTHPAPASVTSHTVSQDKGGTPGDTVLSDTAGLIGRILPSTLEETVQQPASIFQINTKDFPLERNPVAEHTGVVNTNISQPQESLMASLLSNQCSEKLIHAQFVDLSFISQVVNGDIPSVQPNAKTESVAVVHAASFVQQVKSVEIEKDSQFLPPQTEKLKPEQHTISQVSNLKKKETKTITTKSSQNQSLKENQKKPFVGSWVKGLLSRGAAFMPTCISAHNRNTITDLQPSVKGANNFDGFKPKGVRQKANRVSRSTCRCVEEPSADSCSPAAPLPAGSTMVASELVKKQESVSGAAPLSLNPHRNHNGISLASHVEDQIHKLRLKLLKKLKAKKKKLAALMSSPQNGTLASETVEAASHCGSPNDCESIEDLLNELQHQIDLADNKPESTTVPNGTSYNGQSHEEILSELLSPATVSTELSENAEVGFQYLEIGDSSTPAPVPSELDTISQDLLLKRDHTYCSPTKSNYCEEGQPDPLVNNTCGRTLNLESPMKSDIFDEFFSTSALNSLANDTLDLPHFDEYLFENC